MNYKITSTDMVRSLIIDYYLSQKEFRDTCIITDNLIDISVIRQRAIQETEFPIFTDTNAIFSSVIISILNNQVGLYNYILNINRDLECEAWISLLNRIFAERAFGDNNSSFNKGFYLYNPSQVCNLFPNFLKAIHELVREMFSEKHEMVYPYVTYFYKELDQGEKMVQSYFFTDTLSNYYSAIDCKNLKEHSELPKHLLSFPFSPKTRLNPDTANYMLTSLAFFEPVFDYDSFSDLNLNYDV